MKRFGNDSDKVNVIRSVYQGDMSNSLSLNEIVERVNLLGYKIKQENLRQFIRYDMKHKHLKPTFNKKTGRNDWKLLPDERRTSTK